ncbi:hypothetical protein [Xanthobacter versatilis]|uniref:hypothetical protein n=1 Tax=Xanthobacter autotrophicus (strain ATCC BAA-1158 / Py2) TaxID=78245 RepID=UPI00372C1CE5
MRVTVRNISALGDLASQLQGVTPQLLAQSVNRVMEPERTKVRRSLTKTTGAPYQRVAQVTKTEMARPGRLEYRIEGEDSFLPLSVFGARETRKGVSAAPWRTRRVFPGTFMANGQVFHRTSGDRLPIVKSWGPNIAREMTREGGEPVTMWRIDAGAAGAKIAAEVLRRIKVGK